MKGRSPIDREVGPQDEAKEGDADGPRNEGIYHLDEEHGGDAEDETYQPDRPVEILPLGPPVRVVEESQEEGVEVHARVAHEEAH